MLTYKITIQTNSDVRHIIDKALGSTKLPYSVEEKYSSGIVGGKSE